MYSPQDKLNKALKELEVEFARIMQRHKLNWYDGHWLLQAGGCGDDGIDDFVASSMTFKIPPPKGVIECVEEWLKNLKDDRDNFGIDN